MARPNGRPGTLHQPPEWSGEPILEQIARLGAGYREGWPDERTRNIVMGAVRETTRHYQVRLESAKRTADGQKTRLKRLREALDLAKSEARP